MAPTRPSKTTKKKQKSQLINLKPPTKSTLQLLAEATTLQEQNQPLEALQLARDALLAAGDSARLQRAAHKTLGEISVDLGEIDDAIAHFEAVAASLPYPATTASESLPEAQQDTRLKDLDEETSSALTESYLWLAQLSPTGGDDSASWYLRAAALLRLQISALTASATSSAHQTPVRKDNAALHEAALTTHRNRLATTLCALAEVYMTDLSLAPDAEAVCEGAITEAMMLGPGVPDVWQTVANVRISQERREEARVALVRSLGLWWRGDDGDENDDEDEEEIEAEVPAFPTRVALVRLLMEMGMEKEAIGVVEGLLGGDDESVEAWYLGGLGWYMLGEKARDPEVDKGLDGKGSQDAGKEMEVEVEVDTKTWKSSWFKARTWLAQCLQLFEAQEYEDERLGEHARELLETIVEEIGVEGEEGDEEWEDDDGDGDEDEDEDEDDEEMQD